MTEPVTVRNALLPMVAMWAVILLAIAFLADSTSNRVWMAVMGRRDARPDAPGPARRPQGLGCRSD